MAKASNQSRQNPVYKQNGHPAYAVQVLHSEAIVIGGESEDCIDCEATIENYNNVVVVGANNIAAVRVRKL